MSEIKCGDQNDCGSCTNFGCDGEKIIMINQTLESISDLEIQIRNEIEQRKQKSVAWMEHHRQWVQKHCSTPA